MSKDNLNFVGLLSSHRRGELVHEADDLLAEMVAAITEYGGVGELTLKLKVKRNEAEQLEIQPLLTMKKPRRALGMGIFYSSDDGKLSRRDPRQGDLIDDLEDMRETRRLRGDLDS